MTGTRIIALDEQERDRLSTRDLAIYVFNNEEDADRWLRSPQKWLRDPNDVMHSEGLIPNDLIQAGREDEVRRCLIQIDDGVYL